MNEKILYYIWLSNALFPSSTTPKLLFEHFGSIEKIYTAGKDDYEKANIQKADICVLSNKNLDTAQKYYEYCTSNNINFLCYEDSYYPERLRIISNPPPMFYYKGKLQLLDDFPCVTMVGTRSCSERGFRLAYSIGYDAASKGAVIVNGLALGIDGACIAGALDANGYAVGILGCGIDRVYPYGNKDLFDRLSASGLILSEFPPFSKPDGRNFPVRNRVMSALSVATAVFEAADGSGAMITAKHALEQGRRLFAVPGKPYDKTYAGPLELIKDGATVFTEADDILSEYSMSFPHRINLANKNAVPESKLDALVAKYFKKDSDPDAPVNRRYGHRRGAEQVPEYLMDTQSITPSPNIEKKTETNNPDGQKHTVLITDKDESTSQRMQSSDHDLSLLSPTERQIYDLLFGNGEKTPDEIAAFGIKIDDILSALTLLEIYGLVKAIPGGKYRIAN